MSDEFRQRLTQHARIAVERSSRAQSEAATAQYLVLPFIQLLGYDPLDPDEVVPEAHASFSEKFKNRVDYAICKDGSAVIAIECKKVGSLNDGHRGELKGYFNAVPSVKLGILTDGLVWQLYTDTGRENMMDDDPFVAIDLAKIETDGQIAEHALDALVKIQRGSFDPSGVGADAKRKLYLSAYLTVIDQTFQSPSESVVRSFMDAANIDGRRTTKLVEEHAPLILEAMQSFLDRKILERVGFATRGDLIRVPPGGVAVPPGVATPASAVADAAALPAPAASVVGGDGSAIQPVASSAMIGDGIVTTETEAMVFDYVRRRLPFLIDRDEGLFAKLEHLYPRDFKTRFTVCYRQDRNGRLFNFIELTQSPRFRFEFPDTDRVINTDQLSDIDTELLAAFLRRVAELG